MTKNDLFSGVHAVLYALFKEDESLDHAAMAVEVEHCIRSGCHGITVLGLATEVLKLTLEERKSLIVSVSEANKGRLPFSVTIAGNSIGEQADLARFAAEHGADWVILQPPMVGTYGTDIYLDFFERVAAEIDLPFAIQNAPQYLGRALSAQDIASLRQRCPNLKAIKSEDGSIGMAAIIDAAGKDLKILGGRGGLEMIDNLRLGCSGFVLAPDIAPVAVRIFDAYCAGDEKQAEQLYASALPAITFIMQSLEQLITYGKRIFALHCDQIIHDRAPHMAPTQFGLTSAQIYAAQLTRVLADEL